jgi:hypothetical protein
VAEGAPVNPQQARIYALACEFYCCVVPWRYCSIDLDPILGAWICVAW